MLGDIIADSRATSPGIRKRRLDGDIASQLFAFNLDYPGHTGLGPCQQREAERGIVNLSQAGPCF